MQKFREFVYSYHFFDLLFIVMFVFALCLRFFNYQNWQIFDYDQETALKQIRTIVVDHKPVLIGMQASVAGVFVGPLFFYISAPFLLLGKLDPAYSLLVSFSYSVVMLVSLYFVAFKLFGRKAGVIATLIFAVSSPMVASDRVWWNPMFIPLVSVWSFYFFVKFIKSEKYKFLLFSGFFTALSVHFHMSALVMIAWYFLCNGIFAWKILLKKLWLIVAMVSIFLISISPLVVFDLRHNLLNLRNLINFVFSSNSQSLVSNETIISGPQLFVDKLFNITAIIGSIFFDHLDSFQAFVLGATAIFVPLFYLFVKNNRKIVASYVIYLFLTYVFFTLNRGSFLQYYILYLVPLLVIFFSSFLSKTPNLLVCIFLIAMSLNSLQYSINSSSPFSLHNKRKIVEYIKADSTDNSYVVEFIFPDPRPINKYGFSYLFNFYGMEFNENSGNRNDNKYKIVIPSGQIDENLLNVRFGGIGVLKEVAN